MTLRTGEAGRLLSLSAQVGALLHGVFPGLTADVLALVDRALPSSGSGSSRAAVKGEASTSAFSPSLLTKLGDEAALRHNQTGDSDRPRWTPGGTV